MISFTLTALVAPILALSSAVPPALAGAPGPVPAAAPAAPATDVEHPLYLVPERKAEWSELTALFDPAWILPVPRMAEGGPDLVTRLSALAAARWESDDARFRSFGDLAAASAGTGSRARAKLLERFRADQPAAWERFGDMLPQLLDDSGLSPSGWDPDEATDDDGLFVDASWSLEDVSVRPWNGLDGNQDVHQAATLIRADLEAIKHAENDYVTYPGYAGAEYEALYPVPRSHLRAAPREGAPEQVSLQLSFRVDLPFPFSTYSCLLRILNRIDEDGRLVTDIYSTSDDFYWMAGRDVFIPIATTDGDFVGMLTARWFGFDLDGVPDGEGARLAGLRAGLGRLKLRAETAYASVDGGPRTTGGVVPPIVVRGDHRWNR